MQVGYTRSAMLDPHCVVFKTDVAVRSMVEGKQSGMRHMLIQIGMADVAGVCGGHEEQDIDLEWPYTRL